MAIEPLTPAEERELREAKTAALLRKQIGPGDEGCRLLETIGRERDEIAKLKEWKLSAMSALLGWAPVCDLVSKAGGVVGRSGPEEAVRHWRDETDRLLALAEKLPALRIEGHFNAEAHNALVADLLRVATTPTEGP